MMYRRYCKQLILFVAIWLMAGVPAVFAERPSAERLRELEKTRTEMIAYAVDYLRAIQSPDGSFSPNTGIGPTTVVLLGLMKCGFAPDDPSVAAALDVLTKAVQKDGGIYSPDGRIASYESCLALSCFAEAKKLSDSDRYDALIAGGEKYIRSQQYGESNGTAPNDVYYGGIGYGSQTRPDLSNTQFFIETLRDLGADSNDEAIQKALVFVTRCQNYDTGETAADTEDSEMNDGGFIYTRVGEGESPAGRSEEVQGGLRSYGSITYAGLKSLIYAGLTPDDPRVEAATGWLRKNYSLTENPGLGRRGLFYYYHTMAKTLETLGGDLFADADSTEHFWRGELIETLAAAQNPDGSWVNDNRMWLETDPVLVTGYVLIVLSCCALDENETMEENNEK